MRVTSALLGAACAGLLGLGPAPPASAEENPACASVDGDSPVDRVTLESPVLAALDVGRAQQLVERDAPPTGRPVAVAVLDSGVTGPAIPVAGRYAGGTGPRTVTYYHGTAVAGLIAGRRDGDRPVGIAPDAEIIDVRVYDDVDPARGATVRSEAVAAGLRWVVGHADDLGIRIANVSLAVEDSDELARAVRAARRAGIVVVAAAGNRPRDGEPFDDDFADTEPGAGEDAATVLFPTGYAGVVTASSTADGSGEADATPYVLMNSHTTVAVPTFGAISYGLNGAPCVLDPIATSWAAAEVSGVLALLWQRYPHDTDEQVVARLVNAATGTPDDPTPLTGAGVVQVLESLTRPLDPARSGEVERTVATDRDTAPAVAPAPEVDPLSATREDAVWWGLIGGGVLVVALLLRPVLARRRG